LKAPRTSPPISVITHALGVVARAKGMSRVARDSGLSREALYKALTPDGDPKLSTFFSVLKAEIAGRKTLYLSGFALFGLCSALCGLAPSLPSLVVFRILRGMSGSMLGANSVVILVAAVGPARRGKALGIMAAAQAVGLGLGPALGGVLLGTLGWRSIFWVNVPFAFLGAGLAWLIVPRTTSVAKDRRFDALGAML
jgi:MFS family permease